MSNDFPMLSSNRSILLICLSVILISFLATGALIYNTRTDRADQQRCKDSGGAYVRDRSGDYHCLEIWKP